MLSVEGLVEDHAGDADLDRPARGELHGVAHQVEQHLAQSSRVATQRSGQRCVVPELEGDASGIRAGTGDGHDPGDHLGEVELDVVDDEVPGLDLGEVEDVVDDREQRAAGAGHLLGVAPLAGVELGVQEQRGQPDHAVERGPDLVAHRGEELRLGTGGGHRLVAGHDHGLAGIGLRAEQAQGAHQRQADQQGGAGQDQWPLLLGRVGVHQQQRRRDGQRKDRQQQAPEVVGVRRALDLRPDTVPERAGYRDRAHHPAEVGPAIPVGREVVDVADVGGQPAADPADEPQPEPRPPPAPGEPEEERDQDRIEDRVRRQCRQLEERRLLIADRRDGGLPQHQDQHDHDRHHVDEGVELGPGSGGGQGAQHRQGHQQEGAEVEDVGDGGVDQDDSPGVEGPDQVADRADRQPDGEHRRQDPSARLGVPRRDQGQEARPEHHEQVRDVVQVARDDRLGERGEHGSREERGHRDASGVRHGTWGQHRRPGVIEQGAGRSAVRTGWVQCDPSGPATRRERQDRPVGRGRDAASVLAGQRPERATTIPSPTEPATTATVTSRPSPKGGSASPRRMARSTRFQRR